MRSRYTHTFLSVEAKLKIICSLLNEISIMYILFLNFTNVQQNCFCHGFIFILSHTLSFM